MDTNELLDRVIRGESSAVSDLLVRHEPRLRRMIHLRLDARLAARVDPSDIVQDTLAEAHRQLPQYAVERAIPFYPWLRRIAWNKLVDMTRRHVHAKRRSVSREVVHLDLCSDSKMILVRRLATTTSSPSDGLMQREAQARLEKAIDELPTHYHDLIVMKHLEELSFDEIAAVLELSLDAVFAQYRRALERLHRFLNQE